jgi:hypothetical protein
MAEQYTGELERLVRRVVQAWDAWLDADENFGREYEALNAAVEALRRELQEHES